MNSAALTLLRLLFVITTSSAAYQISLATSGTKPFSMVNISSIFVGTLFAIIVIWIEIRYATRFIVGIFTVILGLLVGFIASYLFIRALFLIPHIRLLQGIFPQAVFAQVVDAFEVGITFFFCYMAVAILFKTQHRFKLLIPFVELTKETREQLLILDTSVIIDGRIVTLCDNNILNGILLIPEFVLNELQLLADSSDKQKRVRGRRGLEMLAELQRMESIQIRLDAEKFPHIKEVDRKLIALASKISGILVTNDYNLKKIAELHNVGVINLNVLSNALRPPVLPGDTLTIRIIKQGEENKQGVGYLADGTAVVVENGYRHIGKDSEIMVTNVLQTNVGRMVFGKLNHEK